MDKYTCRVLAGMRTMEERQKSLKDFREGEVRILIATDVATRRIGVREPPFVINVTLPDRP
jgi:ATP-dependent RNA helicase DDX1